MQQRRANVCVPAGAVKRKSMATGFARDEGIADYLYYEKQVRRASEINGDVRDTEAAMIGRCRFLRSSAQQRQRYTVRM